VKESGLRGRGGAGFPTGLKWELARKSDSEVKYLICNADEGDPGAFMDRSIIESDPHSVLEGMLIGAYAIGAKEGFIYIRNEYPLALERIQKAIQQAEEYGLLGEKILGTDFSFTVEVVRGAGAFVCGEETALIASVEGRLGEPRPRPPYPVEAGLWGRPTVINNVETWANVPPIILNGASWFREIGTETSKGTKVFSLVGKINNTGLVEVPMGITLNDIIFKIGGGIPGGKKFKAVQTGGPSGGCIPAEKISLPVDYESLSAVGSMMGSGGMVVMDEDTCMVDIAKYFLSFTQAESCGKCTPCREGTKRMLEILERITAGEGTMDDLALLETLANAVRETSLCGLGKTAPNPVLTTLRYFREEYEEHIRYKRCPAMVCQKIVFTPCKYNCPVKTDIPAFIAHINRGEYLEAFEEIRRNNPFPVITSMICHHPCEDRCRSADLAESISIKALKRFACEQALKRGVKPWTRAKRIHREKVAIIGSGPAGLAAAFDLVQEGYGVTVFEKERMPGGMLATAIPRFRLPDKYLHLEINAIRKTGVEIRTGVEIGKDLSISDLFDRGYKAVLIATGAHQSQKLNIFGEHAEGVLDGLDFLKRVKRGEQVPIGRKVAVIGGGNSAIDAARTAWRLGSEVTIVYRRTRDEMPAIRREIEEAEQEGIRFQFLTAPVRILSKNGRVTALECVRMRLGELDESGRPRPIPIENSNFSMEFDTVIVAIGERPEVNFVPENLGLRVSGRGTIQVDPETLATGVEGIFAAGDVVTGPSTISDSIAQGKLAAEMILKYLRGEPLKRRYSVTPPSKYVPPTELTDEELEEIPKLRRPEMPTIPVEERRRGFAQVERGYDEEMARREARRCLRCDLRHEHAVEEAVSESRAG
jgi:NADH-quinone oxidoreductase subunit F